MDVSRRPPSLSGPLSWKLFCNLLLQGNLFLRVRFYFTIKSVDCSAWNWRILWGGILGKERRGVARPPWPSGWPKPSFWTTDAQLLGAFTAEPNCDLDTNWGATLDALIGPPAILPWRRGGLLNLNLRVGTSRIVIFFSVDENVKLKPAHKHVLFLVDPNLRANKSNKGGCEVCARLRRSGSEMIRPLQQKNFPARDLAPGKEKPLQGCHCLILFVLKYCRIGGQNIERNVVGKNT